MTLHLEYQAELAGAFAEIDLTAQRVGPFRLMVSDAHPAVLTFDVRQPQHTLPLGLRKYIRFWDDAGHTPDGIPQSASNPLFEGFVWEIEPAESNRLRYVAYDPSHLSGREVPVMSTAWDTSPGAGVPPQPGLGAVPRLILNASIDNDVDYGFERAHDLSIGDIIGLVLDDALQPLRWFAAAPPADVAYQTSDLALFSYIPQEKIVSTNESIRAFLDRLTQEHYPEFAFRWDPGSRYWRWYSRLAAPAVTLTLNDFTADNKVLALELHRSLEGRYPAIRFCGPETAGPTEIFSTLDGTLAAIDEPTVLETYTDIHGTGTVEAHGVFQIVNVDSRRGARLLPAPEFVRENDYFWVSTRSPYFELSFDLGLTWQAVESFGFDFQHGIAFIPAGLYPYFWSDHELQYGSTQHFWVPNAYRLVWAPYHDPITVRRPTSGYAGTSYTVAGQTSELLMYDEMLAVGYNRAGIAVTTESRVAQYEQLGDALLAAQKDIIYTGGCLLEGLLYDFCRLGRCVNLAAVDHDGNPLTTGWEAINAVVSDVEYDFARQTTALTFSQAALLAWGDNVDLLHERLRIGLVEKIRIVDSRPVFSEFQSPYTPGGPIQYQSGIVYHDEDLFYDPQLGTLERAL